MLLSAGKLFLIITNIYQHKLFYFDNIGFLSEPWILMTNYKIYIKQEAPKRPYFPVCCLILDISFGPKYKIKHFLCAELLSIPLGKYF